MKQRISIAIVLTCSLVAVAARAQTAGGVINATLINKNGIALVFSTNPSGLTLGGGPNSATVNFGTVSAYGPLAPGVTRPAVTGVNFTVRTPFDINVSMGGVTSPSYTLRAGLAAAAPAGFAYAVGGVAMTTTLQTLTATGPYNTNVPYNLDLVISSAPAGSGGPATGTPTSATINFQAVTN